MFPPEEVPSKEGKLAGAGLVAPSHKSDVSLGYAEFKRDLLVRLPRLKLPGNGGLGTARHGVRWGTVIRSPPYSATSADQGEYAEDAPKLARGSARLGTYTERRHTNGTVSPPPCARLLPQAPGGLPMFRPCAYPPR